MQIIQFTKDMIKDCVDLWNEETKNSIYQPFSIESFNKTFFNHPYQDTQIMLTIVKDNKVIGFGHACTHDLTSLTPGFITLVVVNKENQRKGYGTLLIKSLEKELGKLNKTFVKQYFLNPVNLRWYIPNTNNHDHPNTPGVLINSPWYHFLQKNGYIDLNVNQDVYYMDITKYQLPEKVVEIEEKNKIDGYEIVIYNNNYHGFDELFQALKNPVWHKAVKNNLELENPRPMLVVIKNKTIYGWTGPLFTEMSGRGYFAGIGVHPNTQGKGLGKALFCELVNHSKKNGARFMSLFTGETNPARHIYMYAGFKKVVSFAILNKDL